MTYEIELIHAQGIIMVRYFDFIHFDESRQVLEEILSASREQGYRKILIYFKKYLFQMSVTDLYELGKAFAKSGLITVAYVCPENKIENRFLVTTARNCGAWIKYFELLEDACEWLKTTERHAFFHQEAYSN